MKTRVKHFSEAQPDSLERAVNEFLESLDTKTESTVLSVTFFDGGSSGTGSSGFAPNTKYFQAWVVYSGFVV